MFAKPCAVVSLYIAAEHPAIRQTVGLFCGISLRIRETNKTFCSIGSPVLVGWIVLFYTRFIIQHIHNQGIRECDAARATLNEYG